MACLYPVYVELYGRASAARDRGLVPARTGSPPHRRCDSLFVAQLAIGDVADGLPLRAREQVCRLVADGDSCDGRTSPRGDSFA